MENEILQQILSKLDIMQNDIVEMKSDIIEMKSDIEIIKEDTEITRDAANTLIKWADRASKAIEIPIQA